jgi:hypothetical protein
MLVDILSCGWWNKWGNYEVDIGYKKEDSDWKRGAHWRVPLLRAAVYGEGVQVEVHKTSRHEDIDYS